MVHPQYPGKGTKENKKKTVYRLYEGKQTNKKYEDVFYSVFDPYSGEMQRLLKTRFAYLASP